MSLGNLSADQLKAAAERLIKRGDCSNFLHRKQYKEILTELDGRSFGANALPGDLTNAQLQDIKRQTEAARQARDRSAAMEMCSGAEAFDEI